MTLAQQVAMRLVRWELSPSLRRPCASTAMHPSMVLPATRVQGAGSRVCGVLGLVIASWMEGS